MGLSHKKELTALDKQCQIRIEIVNKTHEQQLNEYQKKTDLLLVNIFIFLKFLFMRLF
jgi:hypothetical protein